MDDLTPKIVSEATPQTFVVADSKYELEIKDVATICSGKQIVSDEISLNLADASWTIKVKKTDGITWFYVDLYDVPDELRKKCQKEFLVLCKGKLLPTKPTFSFGEWQITHLVENLSRIS